MTGDKPMADDPRVEALARVYAGTREWETLTALQQDACRYQAEQFCRLFDTARTFGNPGNGQKIIDGLRDAVAFAKGDETKARVTTVVVPQPKDEPPQRRKNGFNVGNGRVQESDRIELLSIDGSRTGRLGRAVSVLQDGEVDIELDDGLPPFNVKWRHVVPALQPQPNKEVMPHQPEPRLHNASAPAESSVGAAPEMRQATEEELQAQRASWARGQMAMGDDRQEAEDRLRLSAEPSAGADPPWLEQVCKIAYDAYKRPGLEKYPSINDWIHEMVRVVLGFAARQPREDYEEVLTDHRALVRQIDVLMNGEAGAAKQASLCDLMPQLRELILAARQPRAITDAEVEEAYRSIRSRRTVTLSIQDVRAALEAAERARRGG